MAKIKLPKNPLSMPGNILNKGKKILSRFKLSADPREKIELEVIRFSVKKDISR